jgi:predicted transcriptional regulator of viral defense system
MRLVVDMRPQAASQRLDWRLASLAADQHGVAASRQLLTLGFSPSQIKHRLRAGRLHRLHRGVYAVGHANVTREARWLAAVLAGGEPALLSHRDAAALWRMADYAGGLIEITTPGTGARARAGIRIHRARYLAPEDVSSHCRIPVTSPARTLLDLAAVLGRRHLELALEEALRIEVVTAGALREQVERNPGRKGVLALRDLLVLDTSKIAETKSRLEARFLRFCDEERLPPPEVNAWVGGYEVDMSWPTTNVIVELDSWEFHRGRASGCDAGLGAMQTRTRIGPSRGGGCRPLTRRRG